MLGSLSLCTLVNACLKPSRDEVAATENDVPLDGELVGENLWALHGKNRLQKTFVSLNIRRVAELLVGGL